MPADDLERPDLDELDWSAEHRSASLSAVFSHAVRFARGAEDWYARKRRSKRRWGRALRVSAILLGAGAAVLPIIIQIFSKDNDPWIAPGWEAVVLAAAATLVALDRYLGFSTGWRRFMAAELRITRLRHDFEYAWQAARAAADTPSSDGEASELLGRARDFILAVDDVMVEETAAWMTEFQTSLERAEENLDQSKPR